MSTCLESPALEPSRPCFVGDSLLGRGASNTVSTEFATFALSLGNCTVVPKLQTLSRPTE